MCVLMPRSQIAVPTSAGFGASLGGLAPLLANLCKFKRPVSCKHLPAHSCEPSALCCMLLGMRHVVFCTDLRPPVPCHAAANTPGVMLCNVDNGYGAASMAIRMLKMASRLHNVRSAAEAASAAAEAAARAMPIAVAQEAPSGFNNN